MIIFPHVNRTRCRTHRNIVLLIFIIIVFVVLMFYIPHAVHRALDVRNIMMMAHKYTKNYYDYNIVGKQNCGLEKRKNKIKRHDSFE